MKRSIWSLRVLLLFLFWGASIVVLARNGLLEAADGQPPLGILLAALGPAAIFLLSYKFSAGLRQFVAELDLAHVFELQAWRVVGAAFLFTWGYGLLPGGFAIPAGVGDIAVGLAAPFVAMQIAERSEKWKKSAYLLIAAGIFDFVVAFGTGMLFQEGGSYHLAAGQHSGLLAEFPLTLIPSFLVPAFLILHIIAFIKLRHAK